MEHKNADFTARPDDKKQKPKPGAQMGNSAAGILSNPTPVAVDYLVDGNASYENILRNWTSPASRGAAARRREEKPHA